MIVCVCVSVVFLQVNRKMVRCVLLSLKPFDKDQMPEFFVWIGWGWPPPWRSVSVTLRKKMMSNARIWDVNDSGDSRDAVGMTMNSRHQLIVITFKRLQLVMISQMQQLPDRTTYSQSKSSNAMINDSRSDAQNLFAFVSVEAARGDHI